IKFLKSFNNLLFRAKGEIFAMQHTKNPRFLLLVEITNSLNSTFSKFINKKGGTSWENGRR
ncbi:MAG: hypothetical protein MUO43_14060, partial [Desulfobacterales bacterium]|nr:hypothetical protein [Desulfobacterales bacterium]